MTSSPLHSSGHTARTKQTREPAFRGMSRHNASVEGAEISTGLSDEDTSFLLSQSYRVSKSIISSGNNIPYATGRGLTTRQRTLLEPTSASPLPRRDHFLTSQDFLLNGSTLTRASSDYEGAFTEGMIANVDGNFSTMSASIPVSSLDTSSKLEN
jgi:hypothetical protein